MTGEEADWIELKSDPGMPSKLVAWRQKLSDKAKQEETFRFYSLYSLVCHPETLKFTPTPNLKPLIGEFKVEPAVPWFVFWRPTSRLFLMPSRSVARPRRGGPKGRGRSAATASLVLIL